MTKTRLFRIALMSAMIVVIVYFAFFKHAPHLNDNHTPQAHKLEKYWSLPDWHTNMHVIAYSGITPLQGKEISHDIIAQIDKLDAIIDEFNPDSEAGKLRRHELNEALSPELFEILQKAAKVSEQTSGAFDITVGALVDLWKQCGKEKRLPKAAEIEEARRSIGWKSIVLDLETHRVRIDNPRIRVELGAISKGYAVDYVADFLKERGIASGLVDIGGEVAVFGDREWVVGIIDPRVKDSNDLPLIAKIAVRNMAIATSGHYFRHYEIAGKKYSHIMDPRSCKPVPWRILSATVIAKNCTLADAYATALCILPVDESMQLAKTCDFEAFIITPGDSGLQYHISPGFEKYWRQKPKER